MDGDEPTNDLAHEVPSSHYPSQISRIFKDNNFYSFDLFIDMICSGVGNVSREAKNLVVDPSGRGLVFPHPNPKQQVLVHTGMNLLHEQLL